MRANMLFWPLVVLCLAMVALYLDAPVEGFLRDPFATERGVYLVVMGTGLTMAAAGRRLVRGGAQSARHTVSWLVLLAGVVIGYANGDVVMRAYELMRGDLQPSVALSSAQGRAELRRAWDGHYRADAEVNGVPIRLMVDTGASMVLLPYEDVRALGIDPADLEFSLPVSTANGASTVAPVRLSSIKVGPIAVFNVEAAVARPGRLKTGLLGMSFIERLSEASFRGDTMILRN